MHFIHIFKLLTVLYFCILLYTFKNYQFHAFYGADQNVEPLPQLHPAHTLGADLKQTTTHLREKKTGSSKCGQ